MTRLRIFITGSTGFIGGNLARKLADSGYRVHALCRSAKKAKLIEHKNIRIFEGDVLDTRSLEKAMEGCGHVYHLGACTTVLVQNRERYYRVNVSGTVNVLETALRLGGKRAVVTSTAGVLGPSSGRAIDEASERTTDFFNDYDRSKYLMERKIEDYVNKGLHVVLVNPTRVYGPGLLSQANSATKIIQLYMRGKWRIIPGNGGRISNYVFIEDVVKGHILAMEKGRAGERYILGGPNSSYSSFCRAVADVSHKKYRMFHISEPLLMGMSRILALFSRVSGSPPLITPQYVRKYLRDWEASSEKAVKELGYSITPLETGLRRTVAWLNEMNQQKVLLSNPEGGS